MKNTGKDKLQSPIQILSVKQYLIFQGISFSTRSLGGACHY